MWSLNGEKKKGAEKFSEETSWEGCKTKEIGEYY
jgi:hypothetical protein